MAFKWNEVNQFFQDHRALENGRSVYFWHVTGLVTLAFCLVVNLVLFFVISENASSFFSDTQQIVFGCSLLSSVGGLIVLLALLSYKLYQYHPIFKARNIIGYEMCFAWDPDSEGRILAEVYPRSEPAQGMLRNRLKKLVGISLKLGGKDGYGNKRGIIGDSDSLRGCHRWKIELVCWSRRFSWNIIENSQDLMVKLTDGKGRSIELSLIEALQLVATWSVQEYPTDKNGDWPKEVLECGWTIDYIFERVCEDLLNQPIKAKAAS